jgi:hypothetical protein
MMRVCGLVLALAFLPCGAQAAPAPGGVSSTSSTGGSATAADVTSFTAGGTAQSLFGGVVPADGWALYNPNASDDCWVSDSTTAAVNGAGSIRLVANGGGYETPAGYRPSHAVSLICPNTGDKMTARRW